MDKKIKALWISDFVVATGFANVSKYILKYLPEDKYEVDVLAVNYYGDPHEYSYRVYPASAQGDIYGIKRLADLARNGYDLIYILNDAWVVDSYLEEIKKVFNPLPKVVVYFPVDAKDHNPAWYSNFDIVTKAVTYTQFAYDVVKKVAPNLNLEIISHGVDNSIFYKLNGKSKVEIKKQLFGDKREDLYNSFIVLNGNRNQPRKRIDITIKAFALFAKGKPNNVKLYYHGGYVDSHIDIGTMASRYGVDSRLIITSGNRGIQQIPVDKLNLIYNATDVGLNTGLGEGFGLVNAEHAATGAPQVVADHSALHELYQDCGLLVPTYAEYTLDNIMTTGLLVRPEDVASKLEDLYVNKDLYNDLSNRSSLKFNSTAFSWKEISKTWDKLFTGIL